MFGNPAEKVPVRLSAEHFCAVAIAMKKARGKDTPSLRAGFGLKFFQRCHGNAVSAVEMVKDLKELGSHLMVRARALGLGAGLLGLWLRGCGGAYSFMNSHGLPDLLSGELRLGRVRC
jgi:hypothetical protein